LTKNFINIDKIQKQQPKKIENNKFNIHRCKRA